MYMSEKIPMENTVSCYQGRREGGGQKGARTQTVTNLQVLPGPFWPGIRAKRGPDTVCVRAPFWPEYRAKKGPGHKLLQIYKYCKI